MSPGPLTALKRPLLSGAPGLSVCFDQYESRNESKIPDGEIEHGADDEAVHREIGLRDLFEVLAEMLVFDIAERLRPDVEPVYSKEDGNEEHEEQRQRAHGRAQDAANHRAPAAAGEMADHENRHRAQSDAQPAHEAEQVGAIELIGLLERQHNGDHREDDADHERALRDFSYDLGRRQIEMGSGRGAHFCSSVCELVSESMTGRVAPEPGWPRNFGGSEGTVCPLGTSARVAF